MIPKYEQGLENSILPSLMPRNRYNKSKKAESLPGSSVPFVPSVPSPAVLRELARESSVNPGPIVKDSNYADLGIKATNPPNTRVFPYA